MKRFAVVLTLILVLVFSTFSVTSAVSKFNLKNPGGSGGVTTCGPVLPGGSWEEN